MTRIRYLTGITTTGTPHLGNYVGAIRPAVRASQREGTQNYYFLADYHALIKCDKPARVQESTLQIAAAWIAAGLNPDHVFFYRQSDIPEIPELTWLLTCVTGKGVLNRAHAYKSQVEKNTTSRVDPDTDVTAGLFMYPVLMAADILLFKANRIPVGKDQAQHIEMARHIASSFNHTYGEHFVLPEAEIDESVALLPGLDGRKMSKSYDNVIPLFASAKELKQLIYSILTDSAGPDEPKQTNGTPVFEIFRAFADAAETEKFKRELEAGLPWGEAKRKLFERIDSELAPMRERYKELTENPSQLEDILIAGAERVRSFAVPFLQELRTAVGLQSLTVPLSPKFAGKVRKPKSAFKQFTEHGAHFFKVKDFLSVGPFPNGHAAAEAIERFKVDPDGALVQFGPQLRWLGIKDLSRVRQAVAAEVSVHNEQSGAKPRSATWYHLSEGLRRAVQRTLPSPSLSAITPTKHDFTEDDVRALRNALAHGFPELVFRRALAEGALGPESDFDAVLAALFVTFAALEARQPERARHLLWFANETAIQARSKPSERGSDAEPASELANP